MSQYHICIWTGEGLSKCFSVLELAYLSGGTTDMLDIFKRIRCDCDSRLSSALDLAFRMLKKMITNKQLWIPGSNTIMSWTSSIYTHACLLMHTNLEKKQKKCDQ